jgi:diguanylate cyclase
MSWFQRNTPTPPAGAGNDAELLRDGLVVLLQASRNLVPGARAQRVDKLVERLARLPAPSGLVREVRALTDELRPGADGDDGGGPRGVDPEAVGRMASALVSAMQAVGLVHTGLENRLTALAAGVPRRLVAADMERIAREAGEIGGAAGPIRKRAIQDRQEMAKMIQALGRRLGDADEASESLGRNVEALSQSLIAQPSPEELRRVRTQLLEQLDRLATDARTLRGQLDKAKENTRNLQAQVQKQAEELVDVRARAAQDPMTGVCNRGTFDRAFAQEIDRARKMESSLALVMLDIDHFKKVNDTYGHPAGDAVLIGFARTLVEQVREGDIVARLGGEEFALLLPGAGEHVAAAVAERVRSELARQVFPDPAQAIRCTVSAGVAILSPDDSPASLLKRADDALYSAKHGGRNQVRLAA